MTGRRLYDLHCDAVHDARAMHDRFGRQSQFEDLRAWPFLSDEERQMWGRLASRLSEVE